MAKVLGPMTTGAVVDTDTPIYQSDDTTTANMTYIRWENTTAKQLIERINETTGTIVQFTWDNWTSRVTATYTP